MAEIVKTKLLVSIVDKGKDEKILKLYKRHKINYSICINGIGTASSSLRAYFGLDDVKKNIILSVVPEKLIGKVFYDLHYKVKIYNPGEGIVFSLPITSATRYLSNQYADMNFLEEYVMKNDKEYELIILIVLEGYSQTAMDAAKSVGAGGGTLIHGIGLGSKEATKFLGITIEPEKDVVLLLVEKESKHKIMNAVTEAVGLSHEGRGICFSLPVDDVVGLTERLDFVKQSVN